MPDPVVHRWRPIEPLGDLNGSLGGILDTVDALQQAWEEYVALLPPEDFAEARRRSLRRHAIETGIIERLYDVSWGVTEALVAEGLTREVAAREGGVDETALETIVVQFDALEFLSESARNGRELSVYFIKQVHALITKNQSTYEAHDALGRAVELPFTSGEWKPANNHVSRPDGSVLEYAPFEHVASEMDRLVALYEALRDEHPVVRAAWLHHRFIQIHPFADGNGRVARALVLLVLLQDNFAPLVVEGARREDYILALDAANDGDLAPLVRFLAGLEIVALRAELSPPALASTVGDSAVSIARGYAERLRGIRLGSDEAKATAVAALALDVQMRVEELLGRISSELRDAFRTVDSDAWAQIQKASPPDERSKWWHAQLVRSAKGANFFSNLSGGTWWVLLRIGVLGQRFQYVVAGQKVGQGETGILAVTVFAELLSPREEDDGGRFSFAPLIETASVDSVTLNQSDSVDDRWPEISALIERTLAASMAEFGRLLT